MEVDVAGEFSGAGGTEEADTEVGSYPHFSWSVEFSSVCRTHQHVA